MGAYRTRMVHEQAIHPTWVNPLADVSEHFGVEAMGLEPTNLLTASQALYQLSYAPVAKASQVTVGTSATAPWAKPSAGPRTKEQRCGTPFRSGGTP
jgi:hypothetical protein